MELACIVCLLVGNHIVSDIYGLSRGLFHGETFSTNKMDLSLETDVSLLAEMSLVRTLTVERGNLCSHSVDIRILSSFS